MPEQPDISTTFRYAEDLKAEYDTLAVAKKQADEEIENLQARLSDSDSTIDHLASQNDELRGELQKADQTFRQQYESEIERLGAVLKEKERELAGSKVSFERTLAQLGDIERQATKLLEAIPLLRNPILIHSLAGAVILPLLIAVRLSCVALIAWAFVFLHPFFTQAVQKLTVHIPGASPYAESGCALVALLALAAIVGADTILTVRAYVIYETTKQKIKAGNIK